MAISTVISNAELTRLAALAYEGQTIKVCLANVGTTGLTVESTVSQWNAVRVSGGGYADFTTTIATGAFDAGDGRYEMGATPGANTGIEATFTATGSGFTYDSIYVVIGSSTYLHSLISETPAKTLTAGNTIVYSIQLAIGI